MTQPIASPAAARAPTPLLSNIHVLASLRKHRRLAILVALLTVLTGLPLAWKLGSPGYSATAVIYVSPRFIANLADNNNQKFDSMEQYREYVQQNVKTINRFDIVLQALADHPELQPYWVRPGESLERAAGRLQGALDIEAVMDTYQIAVTLGGKKKAGLAELVNAVADTYLEKAKAEEFYSSDQRVRSLVADQARLRQEIADKQAKRMAVAQDLGVSSFTESEENPYDRLLVSAREDEADANKDSIHADTELAVFDEKQHPGATQALHAYALSEANKDPVLQSALSILDTRAAQVLVTLSGLSADHPGRRAAEREIAEIEKQKQAAIQAEVNSLSRVALDQRTAAAYQARTVDEKLAAEVERQKSQAAWFTQGYQQGIQLGLDVDEDRKTEDNLQERIDYFMLEKNAPGFVRIFSAARVPDGPVKGGRKLFFAVFVSLAGILAVAIPVAIDFLDPTLHSPGQVEDVLGFPLTAWLMEKPDAGPAFEREQIMRFANRIAQEKQANRSSTFAFTSVKSGGGSTTIVLETAHALRSLGVRALAIEANSYRSDSRFSRPGGLAVLAHRNAGRVHDSEIIPADERMPDRIRVAEIAEDAGLPGIENLKSLLRHEAGNYDVILLDVPPILASVDSEIIAVLADVVVLVIEAESVSKQELRRAALSLDRLKVNALSTVFNRVRRDEASGAAATVANEFLSGAAPRPPLFSSWLLR